MSSDKLLKVLMAVVLMLPLPAWAATRGIKSILFDINCGERIKRAADANTIELAKQEMDAIVAYLESNDLTSGYTSVIYRSPNEDVGFWYKNLKSAKEELYLVTPSTTQLEKTNILIKLRETLVDHSASGVKVTIPEGISVFPNNMSYFLWCWVSIITFCLGGWILYLAYGKNR